MSASSCTIVTNDKKEELQQHGTTLFPIAYYEESICDDDIPWHWHDDLEIIWITSGALHVSVNSSDFLLQKGQGIFINAGLLHSVGLGSTTDTCLHSLVFHPRLVGSIDSIFWTSYIEPLIQNSSIPYILLDLSLPWHQRLLDFADSSWCYLDQKKYGYEFHVRNNLSELILLISQQHTMHKAKISLCTIRNSARIKQLIQYIQNHYSDEITLSSLSQIVSISESEVLRCFHQTIHTTPTQYLKLYRIQQATKMLKSTDKSIIEIAFECGFKSSSYFSKTFKAIMNCTPICYRNSF